jgi:hypothetical protein
MEIQHAIIGDGELRQPPVPNGPKVEVVAGAQDGSPLAVLQVTVPQEARCPNTTTGRRLPC